ncbi:MAG: signal peptidase II [Holosporaceae bacterium]|jgi:signal peptidase II|nr:signal peptidase II [Holosporaceae bacterium]
MWKVPKSFESKSLTAFLFSLVIICDQLSKYIVAQSMFIGETFSLTPFFNLVRVENTGVTFGLFKGTAQPFVFALISLIIVIWLCVWVRSNKHLLMPVGLIISGAIGNLIDRFTYKAVIDFLDFHLLIYHWPAFNIADSAIVIGMAILFFGSYMEDRI